MENKMPEEIYLTSDEAGAFLDKKYDDQELYIRADLDEKQEAGDVEDLLYPEQIYQGHGNFETDHEAIAINEVIRRLHKWGYIRTPEPTDKDQLMDTQKRLTELETFIESHGLEVPK